MVCSLVTSTAECCIPHCIRPSGCTACCSAVSDVLTQAALCSTAGVGAILHYSPVEQAGRCRCSCDGFVRWQGVITGTHWEYNAASAGSGQVTQVAVYGTTELVPVAKTGIWTDTGQGGCGSGQGRVGESVHVGERSVGCLR